MSEIPNLTETELAYIAGIIDGEGTISLSRNKALHSLTGYRFQPRLTIANSNLELIHWLRERLSLGKPCVITSHSWRANKPVYVCSMMSFRVIGLLKQILPYLIVKKEQAKLVMKYGELRKQKNFLAYGLEEYELYKKVVGLNLKKGHTLKPMVISNV